MTVCDACSASLPLLSADNLRHTMWAQGSAKPKQHREVELHA